MLFGHTNSKAHAQCVKNEKILYIALLKFFFKTIFVLSLFSSPHDLFLPGLPKFLAKISQRPENRNEGLVKITYGVVASSFFKRAVNSN